MKRIHALCDYLRRMEGARCEQCSATWISPDYGRLTRGCWFRAREVSNIAKFGGPWRDERANRDWRKRIQKELATDGDGTTQPSASQS